MSTNENFARELAAGLVRKRIEQTVLIRDVRATRIPDGDVVLLESGTEVTILQSNDGAYSIQVPVLGAACRIGPPDVDALGKRLQERVDPQVGDDADGDPADPNDDGPASLRRQIDAQLRRVYDPELPLSIVDLGLIYDLRVVKTDAATFRVEIEMTLTTQACGMGPTIAREVRERLRDLPRVGEIDIDIVWEPQWTPHRISKEGRKKLGIE